MTQPKDPNEVEASNSGVEASGACTVDVDTVDDKNPA